MYANGKKSFDHNEAYKASVMVYNCGDQVIIEWWSITVVQQLQDQGQGDFRNDCEFIDSSALGTTENKENYKKI